MYRSTKTSTSTNPQHDPRSQRQPPPTPPPPTGPSRPSVIKFTGKACHTCHLGFDMAAFRVGNKHVCPDWFDSEHSRAQCPMAKYSPLKADQLHKAELSAAAAAARALKRKELEEAKAETKTKKQKLNIPSVDTWEAFADQNNVKRESGPLHFQDQRAIAKAYLDSVVAQTGPRICACGLAVSKPARCFVGTNAGREFICCSKRRCRYFRWCDTLPENQVKNQIVLLSDEEDTASFDMETTMEEHMEQLSTTKTKRQRADFTEEEEDGPEQTPLKPRSRVPKKQKTELVVEDVDETEFVVEEEPAPLKSRASAKRPRASEDGVEPDRTPLKSRSRIPKKQKTESVEDDEPTPLKSASVKPQKIKTEPTPIQDMEIKEEDSKPKRKKRSYQADSDDLIEIIKKPKTQAGNPQKTRETPKVESRVPNRKARDDSMDFTLEDVDVEQQAMLLDMFEMISEVRASVQPPSAFFKKGSVVKYKLCQEDELFGYGLVLHSRTNGILEIQSPAGQHQVHRDQCYSIPGYGLSIACIGCGISCFAPFCGSCLSKDWIPSETETPFCRVLFKNGGDLLGKIIEPFHDLSRPSPADWDQIWRITWSKSVFR